MERINAKIGEGQIKIGCEVAHLVLALPKINSSVESLTFNIYSPYLGLEERFAQSADSSFREVTKKASDFRKAAFDDIPYWESILVAASLSEEKFGFFIQEAIRHDSAREFNNRFEIAVSNLNEELLQE